MGLKYLEASCYTVLGGFAGLQRGGLVAGSTVLPGGLMVYTVRPEACAGSIVLGGHAGLQYWKALHVYSIGRPMAYSIGRPCGSQYSRIGRPLSVGLQYCGEALSHSSGRPCGFMAAVGGLWALRADSIWRPYGATASKHKLVVFTERPCQPARANHYKWYLPGNPMSQH